MIKIFKLRKPNLAGISREAGRRNWSYNEQGIIINAIELRNGRAVNVQYLSRLLSRSVSSIRNKVFEFADKLQDFKIETTIMEFKGESYDEFILKVQNPIRKNKLIMLFFKFNIFNGFTSVEIIKNFWNFNMGGKI